MAELFTGPVLFVVLLSVVLLVFPALFLYKMLRERRLFERYLRR